MIFPFRSYCGTFWNLPLHSDELNQHCRDCPCPYNQYKCQTGQCIEFDWLCDRERLHHNIYLPNFDIKLKEFPCLLANVKNLLDIELNHPCINLIQIVDEREDCHAGLDERNTLESCDRTMLGFSYQCTNTKCSHHDQHCVETIDSCVDEILCHYISQNESCVSEENVVYFDGSCRRNARCDERGLESIWSKYRNNKRTQKILQKLYWSIFPTRTRLLSEDFNKTNSSQVSQPFSSTVNKLRTPTLHSHSYIICNRGVAIRYTTKPNEICLCPLSYYGRWCEYFSDRLIVITYLDLTSLYYLEYAIDSHEFDVNGYLEIENFVKHRFYPLYPTSDKMKALKKRRYLNRTDIVNNHPYSIEFVIYHLTSDAPFQFGS
ncbi:hypothetical protein I4U23_000238 [Adineta vaga]|nr:hypothetical protein I4U23_000238 [Adineta vaga]